MAMMKKRTIIINECYKVFNVDFRSVAVTCYENFYYYNKDSVQGATKKSKRRNKRREQRRRRTNEWKKLSLAINNINNKWNDSFHSRFDPISDFGCLFSHSKFRNEEKPNFSKKQTNK